MAISFNDDLSRMLSVQDFGVAATLTTVNSIVITLNGIFDKALEEQENDGALPIIMQTPIFTCRSVDIAAYGSNVDGASLVIDTATYLVREITDDGTGVSELRLERQ